MIFYIFKISYVMQQCCRSEAQEILITDILRPAKEFHLCIYMISMCSIMIKKVFRTFLLQSLENDLFDIKKAQQLNLDLKLTVTCIFVNILIFVLQSFYKIHIQVPFIFNRHFAPVFTIKEMLNQFIGAS